MKILVTGGSGFIGSYVVNELINADHTVSVLDTRQNNNLEVVSAVGDLRNFEEVRSAIVGMDAICHIGAIGDVYLCYEDPPLAAAINVHGTANVLEAAIREGVGKVVYASTWEVYGRPDYAPIDEQHPCRPDHPYNITKYAGDLLCQSFRELRNLDTTVLRLGTAYGEGMRETAVLPAFILTALRKEPITIHGTGQQFRQFTHVRDLARGFRLAVERDDVGPVLNLVAARGTSIKQVADLVISEIPTDLVTMASRVGDVPSSTVSSAAAERKMGWKTEIPFRKGAIEMIGNYRNASKSMSSA